MSKILLVAGHGQGDPGASGGGYNEAVTMRQLVNKIKNLIPNDVDLYDTNLDCYQQNGLSRTNYKNVIEFHMDAAENTAAHGGHVIISSKFSPDSLDIALKNVIANHVGVWAGIPDGFSKRSDLQNLNVAANRGISYRLLELGFISNSDDRNKTIGQMDVLAKKLAEAITGKAVNSKPQPPVKPQEPSKPVTNGWIAESGEFTTNTAINLRNADNAKAGLIATLKAGSVVKYNAYRIDQNGYVWIRQPRSNGYGYLATGESKNGKRTNYWGNFR